MRSFRRIVRVTNCFTYSWNVCVAPIDMKRAAPSKCNHELFLLWFNSANVVNEYRERKCIVFVDYGLRVSVWFGKELTVWKSHIRKSGNLLTSHLSATALDILWKKKCFERSWYAIEKYGNSNTNKKLIRIWEYFSDERHSVFCFFNKT